jgi:hypothetical protein
MREQALLEGTPERDGGPRFKELGRERSRTLGKICIGQPGRRSDETGLFV